MSSSEISEDEPSRFTSTMASSEDSSESSSGQSSEDDSDQEEAYFPEEVEDLSSPQRKKLDGRLQTNSLSLGPAMHSGDDEVCF